MVSESTFIIRQRRAMRRAFSTSCQAVRLQGFRLIGERILELSVRGALLACDRRVHPGERVIVSFRAPSGGPYVDAVGEVARVIEGFRFGDPGYCAGIEFTELETRSRHELLVRLAGVPPPVPQRARRIGFALTRRRRAPGLGQPAQWAYSHAQNPRAGS